MEIMFAGVFVFVVAILMYSAWKATRINTEK